MGGAAPEGVISAAMRCLGGHFQGQIYDPEVVQTGLIGESKGQSGAAERNGHRRRESSIQRR